MGERGFDWWIPQSKAGHPLISGLVATSPSVLGPDQSVSEWVNVTSIVKCVEWSVGPDRNSTKVVWTVGDSFGLITRELEVTQEEM